MYVMQIIRKHRQNPSIHIRLHVKHKLYNCEHKKGHASRKERCLLSLTLLNIFLERTMSDTPEGQDGKVSIGDRNMTTLRFTDDIDALDS